jgi:hypothetical protein
MTPGAVFFRLCVKSYVALAVGCEKGKGKKRKYIRYDRCDAAKMRLFMALAAVFLVLHIEGLLTVVALAAELALGKLGHVHLVGTLLHLEYRVMATGAFQSFFAYVLFMAEDDLAGVFRREDDVAAADLFR